ncbi:unnamed protein product [Peronospora belbahrii]|uniref:Uncharacterized protein n=1 Tax=Peronospora belbahrii TaxID=622444 RepID=A0AAU9LAF0_9STRA|nr:unnamed protein product [Peronospora belbahrii]
MESIEMPHCGNLNSDVQKTYLAKKQLGTIWLYDVCAKAEETTSIIDPFRKVFCEKIEVCHMKFRNFMMKSMSLTFSRFEEIMMINAGTVFFASPAKLWETKKYNKTGNFFMHDRIIEEASYMVQRVAGKPEVSIEQEYLSNFDVKPFRSLATLERPKATLKNPTSVTLNFEPSDFLMTSHSFNTRASRHVDPSLVLWNKKRQPRATAILASFIALNNILAPPSYGDNEYFFYASELAETLYTFSDHAMGAIGTNFIDGSPKNSTLCGDMAQVLPIHQDGVPDNDVPLFYLNSNRILDFKPNVDPIYYMKARPWAYYPGPFDERTQNCSFGITVGMLSE